MTRALGFAASLAFCLSVTLLGTSSADAFCRTNSCDPKRGEVCSLDENGCMKGGVDLFWANSCVTFSVQRDGSTKNEITASSFERVIEAAFATWLQADCGSGATPGFGVTSIGQVSCNTVEYNQDQGNANIFHFVDDDWMASGPGNALALTTVWYDWRSGKIYDADVEVNGSGGDITNGEPGDGADLPSIITHEAGHFLGLDHSPFNTSATMFTSYSPAEGNLRTLSTDDMAGICAIYPPDRVGETDVCTPRHGFSSTCRKDDDGGCAVTSGASPSSAPWAVLVLGVAFGLLRRRRRPG